jgi:hypothetical protein
VKAPTAVAVHDRVEVPEVVALRVILVGLRMHVRPVAGEMASVKATVPTKPLVAVTVIIEVAGVPTTAFTAVGLAVTVKFGAAPTV